MTDSNMFDPTTLVIDFDLSPDDGCYQEDFTFAFNNSTYSDRILRICIFSDDQTTQSPSERVKTLYISSPILAAKSPFFYKLFSNGMRESKQCHATLRINATEEAGLMELLKFMYSNNLKVTTASAVLDVLIVADKFDVASCIRYCGRLLRNLPMTPESVLVYLDLPSTVLMSEAFQPLTVAAKRFYVVHFKDITKFPDEILSLPLDDVEAIIASDDLQVVSEDEVCHFVIKWTRAQYPKIEDRRKIIATLAKFIRYPYMTRAMLTSVVTYDEFDLEFALKVVTEAISFQAEVPDRQHTYIRDETSSLNRRFVERAYTLRPIKMVEFLQPRPHCVVYLELKRDICANLFTSGNVYSQSFYLGNQRIYFKARRYMDRFRLLLAIVKEAGTLAFDCEFAIRYSKPAQEFVSIFKKSFTLTGGKATEVLCLKSIPWTRFIGEDSHYFIGDVYHVRVELTEQSFVEGNLD